MQHIRLTDPSHQLFNQAWELYEAAFPLEERRPLPWQLDILPHTNYNFELILQDKELLGILLWWSFDEIRYIEHFATTPEIRGKGYGKLILKDFIKRDARPALLEVELPHDEAKYRRIRFYEQNGFILNHHFYQQPPYHQGQQPLNLLLMSYPAAIRAEDVVQFVQTRHPLIYSLL